MANHKFPDRVTRAAWNYSTQLAFTLVTLIVALTSVPFLLRFLGHERFGAAKVIGDWFGYLLLIEMGMGTSLLALLAQALGRGDENEGRNLLTAAWQIYLKLSTAMFVAGLLLAAAMPALLKRQHLTSEEIWLAAAISLLGLLLLPMNIGRILVSIRQRDYVTNIFLLIQSILSTALLLFLAKTGWGLPGQMIGLLLGQAPLTLFLGGTLRREFPGFWRGVADPQVNKKLWASNWPAFFHSLSSRIGLMSDNIILAAIIGPLAVTPFFLSQRLIVIVQTQLQGLGNSSWAGLMELHNQGQSEMFEARTLELTGMVSGLSFAALAPLGAFNSQFVSLWLGSSVYGGDVLTALACANGSLLAVFSFWGWIIIGGGEIRRWLPYAIMFTGVNLVASVAGTISFGLTGPLFGTFVSLVTVQAWAMPHVLAAAFGLSGRKLWWAAAQPAIWGVPFTAACIVASRLQYFPLRWPSLLGQTALAGIMGLGLWWSFSLEREGRRQWGFRMRLILGRVL